MSPDFKVGIYNANDEVVEIRLLTLSIWVHAVKLEMEGFTHSTGNVATLARKFLGAKPSYKIADLYNHLNTSLTDIKGQLGLPT